MARPRAPITRVVTVAEAHGKRFRNKYQVEGKWVYDSFDTEAEAKAAAAKFRRGHAETSGPSVSRLYELWIEERLRQGKPEADAIWLAFRTMHAEMLDAPAASITAEDMRAAYKRNRERTSKYGRPVSASTHHAALMWAKVMWRWAVEERLVRTNPCDGIKAVGEKKRRKAQIETLTELYAFRDRAWALAVEGDRSAVAILVSLYLGARSAEVTAIQARHVDQGAGFPRLVLPGTKTDNAHRSVRVAEPQLWALLCKLADEAEKPTDRIVPHVQQTLLKRVKAIARSAGIPAEHAKRLTFHSLRGMASTLATRGDAAAEAIAKLLGHGNVRITQQHYTTPSAQNDAQQRATLVVLDGGKQQPGNETPPNRSQRAKIPKSTKAIA